MRHHTPNRLHTKKRRVRAAAIAAATTACAAVPALTAPSSAAASSATTITLWGRADFTENASLVKEFNRTHPTIQVNYTPVPDANEVTNLALALRSGKVPDVMLLDDVEIQSFAAAHQLVNLTKLVDSLPYRDSLASGQMAAASYQKHYYAVPFAADVSALFWNKKLFKEAGLNPNVAPASWEQVASDAGKIAKLGHGTYGFSFAGACEGCIGFSVFPVVWAAHQSILSAPGAHQKADFKPLTEIFRIYHEMWAKHIVPPSDQTDNGSTWGNDFEHGTVGLFTGDLDTGLRTGIKFGVSGIPGIKGGRATFAGGEEFIEPLGSSHSKAVATFIKWMLSPAAQGAIANVGNVPVRTDMLTNAFRHKHPLITVGVSALRNSGVPVSAAWNAIGKVAGNPLLPMEESAIFKGDVVSALASGQRAVDALLAQAG